MSYYLSKKGHLLLTIPIWLLAPCHSSKPASPLQSEQSVKSQSQTIPPNQQVAYIALLEEAIELGDVRSVELLLRLGVHVGQELPKSHTFPLEHAIHGLLEALQGNLDVARADEYQACIELLLDHPNLSIHMTLTLIRLLSELLVQQQELLLKKIVDHPSFDSNTHQTQDLPGEATIVIFCLISNSQQYINLAKWLLANCREQIDINRQNILHETSTSLLDLLLPNKYFYLDPTTQEQVLQLLLTYPHFSEYTTGLKDTSTFEETVKQLRKAHRKNADLCLDKKGLALEQAIYAGNAERVAALLAQGVHPNKELPTAYKDPLTLTLSCISKELVSDKASADITRKTEKYEACLEILLEDPRLVINSDENLFELVLLLERSNESLLKKIVTHPGFSINRHYSLASRADKLKTTFIILCLGSREERYYRLAIWMMRNCHEQIDINQQHVIEKDSKGKESNPVFPIHIIEMLLLTYTHIPEGIRNELLEAAIAYPQLKVSTRMQGIANKYDRGIYNLLYYHPSRYWPRITEAIAFAVGTMVIVCWCYLLYDPTV